MIQMLNHINCQMNDLGSSEELGNTLGISNRFDRNVSIFRRHRPNLRCTVCKGTVLYYMHCFC